MLVECEDEIVLVVLEVFSQVNSQRRRREIQRVDWCDRFSSALVAVSKTTRCNVGETSEVLRKTEAFPCAREMKTYLAWTGIGLSEN
jgi:hypothetical protein